MLEEDEEVILDCEPKYPRLYPAKLLTLSCLAYAVLACLGLLQSIGMFLFLESIIVLVAVITFGILIFKKSVFSARYIMTTKRLFVIYPKLVNFWSYSELADVVVKQSAWCKKRNVAHLTVALKKPTMLTKKANLVYVEDYQNMFNIIKSNILKSQMLVTSEEKKV